MTGRLIAALLVVVGFASVVGEAHAAKLDRVVIARMFQKGNPTITAAGANPGAYVCSALTPLDPTYVSGLIRLDDTGAVGLPEDTAFAAVRACLPNAKLDVVLNARHYDGKDGAARLAARLTEIDAALEPDGWFFDFYGEDDPQIQRAMRRANRYAEDHGQFVGGNIWRKNSPVAPGTDLIAITDTNLKERSGMERVHELREALPKHPPVLMHIQNDPHRAGTSGRDWFLLDTAGRKAVLRRHAGGQDRGKGYTYMFPVFFPLAAALVGPSYDASQDGDMLSRICSYLKSGNCATIAAPPLAARPVVPAPGGPPPPPEAVPVPAPALPALRPIHRASHSGTSQHLYSGSAEEIATGPGLVLEAGNYFHLQIEQFPGSVPFHRCYLGNGWHLLTGPGCEGVPGAIDEGALGYIASGPVPGTVPLYRLYRRGTRRIRPDHLYTIDAGERDRAVAAHGYVAEGVAGYVWP